MRIVGRVRRRIEALDGPEAAAGLDEGRTIWVAQSPWPESARTSTQARQLDERFQRACAECEKRIARAAVARVRAKKSNLPNKS